MAVTRASEIGIDRKSKEELSFDDEQQQCDSEDQSHCNSDLEESDYEIDEILEKKEDDKLCKKSFNSDSTANTENLPEKVAEEIEQVVDQLKLGSDKQLVSQN